MKWFQRRFISMRAAQFRPAPLYRIHCCLAELSNKASMRLPYGARNVRQVWRLSPHNNGVEGASLYWCIIRAAPLPAAPRPAGARHALISLQMIYLGPSPPFFFVCSKFIAV